MNAVAAISVHRCASVVLAWSDAFQGLKARRHPSTCCWWTIGPLLSYASMKWR